MLFKPAQPVFTSSRWRWRSAMSVAQLRFDLAMVADSTPDLPFASMLRMPAADPITIHNEQVKLAAASLERAGAAAVTVGVFAPIAAAIVKIEGFQIETFPNMLTCVAFWSLLAAMLYYESQRKLRRLAQP